MQQDQFSKNKGHTFLIAVDCAVVLALARPADNRQTVVHVRLGQPSQDAALDVDLHPSVLESGLLSLHDVLDPQEILPVTLEWRQIGHHERL